MLGKDTVLNLVSVSNSIADVLRKLGWPVSGKYRKILREFSDSNGISLIKFKENHNNRKELCCLRLLIF